MRPESIRKFDLFFLAAIALGVASSLLNYDSLLIAASEPLREAGIAELSETVLIVTLGLGIAINLLLWFLISVLRIGFVRWILLLIVVFLVVTRVLNVAQGANVSLTDLVAVLLKAIAMWFVLRPDAREWFAKPQE